MRFSAPVIDTNVIVAGLLTGNADSPTNRSRARASNRRARKPRVPGRSAAIEKRKGQPQQACCS